VESGTKFRDGAGAPEIGSAVGREKDRQAVLMKKYLWRAGYSIACRSMGKEKKLGGREEKIFLNVSIFAVAITIMLLMALAMNVVSAGSPAKVKVNPEQPYKEEVNLSEEHTVELTPSESITIPISTARSSWSIEIVESVGYWSHTSIALDSNGYPHISYFYWTNYDLKYAKWTGSSWSVQTVDSTGYVGEHAAIALDSNDYPHISYLDSTNHALKYAKWMGSSWSIETVDGA
jgi:hypothetical protein